MTSLLRSIQNSSILSLYRGSLRSTLSSDSSGYVLPDNTDNGVLPSTGGQSSGVDNVTSYVLPDNGVLTPIGGQSSGNTPHTGVDNSPSYLLPDNGVSPPIGDQSSGVDNFRFNHMTGELALRGDVTATVGRITSEGSNPSTPGSTRSSLRLQQEWYVYDPRLVPVDRSERVTMETRYRGVIQHTSLPGIIGPPPYDEIINVTDVDLEVTECTDTDNINWVFGSPPLTEGATVPPHPPPPYSDPPPTYEQTLENDMLNLANQNTPQNDVTRTISRNHDNGQHMVYNNITDMRNHGNGEGQLVNNTQSGTNGYSNDLVTNNNSHIRTHGYSGVANDNDPGSTAGVTADDQDFEMGCDFDTLFDLDHEYGAEGDVTDTPAPLPRYPVGFSLGGRPALRWSRGMGLDRWASSHNWAI